MLNVAVISDTHGLLRPEVLDLVRGVDRILHAGDVGDELILDQLGHIAPVTAVRGNVDRSGELLRLPDVVDGDLEEVSFRMTHRRDDVGPRWHREVDLIIFGHSHRPELEWQSGCMLLNPGAVGGRRFKLPLTMARLTIRDGRLIPEILAVAEELG